MGVLLWRRAPVRTDRGEDPPSADHRASKASFHAVENQRFHVRPVAVARTVGLRRSVLRGGRRGADVHLPEDDVPGVLHLAAVVGDAVVGVVTLAPVSTARRPATRAWRLRAMAVAPGWRGRGVGRALHQAAVDHVRDRGDEVLWADARDAALGFYEHLGWRVEGDGYATDIGLPHHFVVLDLGELPRSASAGQAPGVDGERLRVSRSCAIRLSELRWRFSRSGGPGGQHANTADTRVEVVFDVAGSPSLGPRQRARLLERLGPEVRVVAADERSQARNRSLALERLAGRLAAALRVDRPRRPTGPTPAARRRRVEAKRRRAETKRRRRPVEPDED
jgi:ribosome-associated protein